MTDVGRDKALQFRKKPVVVGAMRWEGGDYACLSTFCGQNLGRADANYVAWQPDDDGEQVVVYNAVDQQWLCVPKGFWIIRGVRGELYPCEPNIFAATYEPASTPPSPVPGWVMVPREFIEAVKAHLDDVRYVTCLEAKHGGFMAGSGNRLRDAYDAVMLSAAPVTAGEGDAAALVKELREYADEAYHSGNGLGEAPCRLFTDAAEMLAITDYGYRMVCQKNDELQTVIQAQTEVLNATTPAGERDRVIEEMAVVAETASLPSHYQWGVGPTERFNHCKELVAAQIRALKAKPTGEEGKK